MKYYMPVEFYFGSKVVLKYGKKIKEYGKKALIVTGKSSAKKSGALDDVLMLLKEIQTEYVIFDKIMQNPEIDTIYEGVKIFRDQQCDFLIGIGGGSPIDSAKAISVIAKNNLKDNEFFNPQNITSSYPIIAIPTTSGTGTEVTPFSVISNKKTKIKAGFATPHIFAKLSLLDPIYTVTLNKTITRDTAIDALSHLLEGIYSTRRNKINYPFIFKGIKLIINNLKQAFMEPDNLQIRENLQLASLYGGMVIAQTGTTLQHAIGYPLTTEFGTTHGLANGLVMKQIMGKFYPAVSDILNDLFSYLKITKDDFYIWLSSLDMQLDAKLDENFYENYIPKVLNSKNMLINPIKITENDILKIYESIE